MFFHKNGVIHKTVSVVFILLFLFWGIGWIFVAALHTAPNAEDFSAAAAANRNGFLLLVVNSLVSSYTRYASAFFYGFNVLTFLGPKYFWVMPLSCFVFFVVSFYYFVTAIIDAKGGRLLFLVFAVFFVLIHFAIEPNLYYGLFYMASFIDYIYPWIFTFFWMGILLRHVKGEKNIWLYFLGYFFVILSYGSSELFIVINSILLGLLFVGSSVYSRSMLKYILPYCLVGLSCVGFLFLCPSPKLTSSNILSDLTSRYIGSNVVFYSIMSYITFFWKYLLHPLSIGFIILLTLLINRYQLNKKLLFSISKTQLLGLFLLSIIGSYLCTCVYFIAKGSVGDFPVYIYNCAAILAQLGMFLFLPLFLSHFVETKLYSQILLYMEQIAMLSLLLILFFSVNNISAIRNEYRLGYFTDLKRKTDQFYTDIEKVKNNGTSPTIVYFQNPSNFPTSIFFTPDILPNRTSACWNIAYEDYFDIDEVRLVNDTIYK